MTHNYTSENARGNPFSPRTVTESNFTWLGIHVSEALNQATTNLCALSNLLLAIRSKLTHLGPSFLQNLNASLLTTLFAIAMDDCIICSPPKDLVAFYKNKITASRLQGDACVKAWTTHSGAELDEKLREIIDFGTKTTGKESVGGWKRCNACSMDISLAILLTNTQILE